MKQYLALLYPALLLSGCALPHTGPSQYELTRKNIPSVHYVSLQMEDIHKLSQETQLREAMQLKQTIIRLSRNPSRLRGDSHIQRGDRLSINLISFTSDGENSTMVPVTTRLGIFPVLSRGTINLPYLHNVRVLGTTYASLQDRLSVLYKKKGVFNLPSVIVQDSSEEQHTASRDAILVTGELPHPTEVAWQAGGVSLAHALTHALSDTQHDQGQTEGGKAKSEYATSVTVIRHDHKMGSLALEDALERDVPLMPGDKIVVRKQAPVKIPVLGGGIRHPDVYGFSKNPTMAQLLASAGDLNPMIASAKNLFVFRYVHGKPTLYRLPYSKTVTVFGIQKMILQNNDIVYVAESPWVPYMQVFAMLVQAGLIASVAR